MTDKKGGVNPNPLTDLRTLRLRAGVSLEAIAESTKISMLFLRAIEAEEFQKLPGGIFDTSYIRQYAAAIGCDPAPILALYRDWKAEWDQAASGQSTKRPAGKVVRTPLWMERP